MATLFKDYLKDQFIDNYHGDKDHFEGSFDVWLENLDGDDFIEYGNRAIELTIKRTLDFKRN